MAKPPKVLIDAGVLRQIRQHARSCTKAEVCGVLIGSEKDHQVIVEACIPGVNASQGGAHVTFTQDTWEHIYQVKDAEYPGYRMVGWYHSHPGFGVFLSDHDTFIHKNFFSAPLQVAWVYDPHSDEEGCFGWVGRRLERLSEIAISDSKGGEAESGKAEPLYPLADDAQLDKIEISQSDAEPSPPWVRWAITVTSYLSVAVLGFAISWFLFPQLIVVPYFWDSRTGQLIGHLDPRTGKVVLDTQSPPGLDSGTLPPPATSGPAPEQPGPGNPARNRESDKGKHAQQ